MLIEDFDERCYLSVDKLIEMLEKYRGRRIGIINLNCFGINASLDGDFVDVDISEIPNNLLQISLDRDCL